MKVFRFIGIFLLVVVIAAAGYAVGINKLKIELKLVAEGFKLPVHLSNAGDGSKRLFLVEQKGRILIIKDGKRLEKPFLDIQDRVGCCGERGLLSVAFPKNFSVKKYFYVNYTNQIGITVVSRFHQIDADIASPQSEEVIFVLRQPYANHNGGQIAFGAEGYLYIGMGDGGSSGDPKNRAQNTESLFGKMLRIDTESDTKPYGIPQDNPFLDQARYSKEIWALGLRNPWRFSFDRETGDLYIADVGQNAYEEVNFQPASSIGGENYGWRVFEGTHPFKDSRIDKSDMIIPLAEYDHSQGCSVTGGYVYRGAEFPKLNGVYFYADYCSGKIWGMKRNWESSLLYDADFSISSFGEDGSGNLYVLDYSNGSVYKITVPDK